MRYNNTSRLVQQQGDRIRIAIYSEPEARGRVILEFDLELQDARGLHEDIGAVLRKAEV